MSPRPTTPLLTVDVIIEVEEAEGDGISGIVLIERRNPPHGWALPGGFVDVGESVEQAAVREAAEETGLEVALVRQFHVYSDPSRDERGHTVSVVFVGRARGTPKAASDAAAAGVFSVDTLPDEIAFDHAEILADYFSGRY
jgi:8-oxo-dGTP diphosphatase